VRHALGDLVGVPFGAHARVARDAGVLELVRRLVGGHVQRRHRRGEVSGRTVGEGRDAALLAGVGAQHRRAGQRCAERRLDGRRVWKRDALPRAFVRARDLAVVGPRLAARIAARP
jgi:hypothetical protein